LKGSEVHDPIRKTIFLVQESHDVARDVMVLGERMKYGVCSSWKRSRFVEWHSLDLFVPDFLKPKTLNPKTMEILLAQVSRDVAENIVVQGERMKDVIVQIQDELYPSQGAGNLVHYDRQALPANAGPTTVALLEPASQKEEGLREGGKPPSPNQGSREGLPEIGKSPSSNGGSGEESQSEGAGLERSENQDPGRGECVVSSGGGLDAGAMRKEGRNGGAGGGEVGKDNGRALEKREIDGVGMAPDEEGPSAGGQRSCGHESVNGETQSGSAIQLKLKAEPSESGTAVTQTAGGLQESPRSKQGGSEGVHEAGQQPPGADALENPRGAEAGGIFSGLRETPRNVSELAESLLPMENDARTVDVADVLSQLVTACTPIAQCKQLTLEHVSPPSGALPLVAAEPHAIRQVLSIVLDNGLR
jgi:hypothetical protein